MSNRSNINELWRSNDHRRCLAYHFGPHLSLLAGPPRLSSAEPKWVEITPSTCLFQVVSWPPLSWLREEGGSQLKITKFGPGYGLEPSHPLQVLQLVIRIPGELRSSCSRQKDPQSLPYCSKEIWGPKSWAESVVGSESLTHFLVYIAAFCIKSTPSTATPKFCLWKSLGNQLKGSVWARKGSMQRLGSGLFFSGDLSQLEWLPDANVQTGSSPNPESPSTLPATQHPAHVPRPSRRWFLSWAHC